MKIGYVIPEEYFVIEMDEVQMKYRNLKNPFIIEQGYNDTLFREIYGNYKTHGHFKQENWAVKKAMELEEKYINRRNK